MNDEGAVITTMSTNVSEHALLTGDWTGRIIWGTLRDLSLKKTNKTSRDKRGPFEDMSGWCVLLCPPPLLGSWQAHLTEVVSVKWDPACKKCNYWENERIKKTNIPKTEILTDAGFYAKYAKMLWLLWEVINETNTAPTGTDTGNRLHIPRGQWSADRQGSEDTNKLVAEKVQFTRCQTQSEPHHWCHWP